MRQTLLPRPVPPAPPDGRSATPPRGGADRRTLLRDAVAKLHPRDLAANPVMLVVEVGAVLVTLVWLRDLLDGGADVAFSGLVAGWLWATVLFATGAEALAEGRGRTQAASLRAARTDTTARRRRADGTTEEVPSGVLVRGDVVEVGPGEVIPGDGEVVEGIATVDESAITGESAPVIRESGGDRSAVTGGTRVLSDRIVVRVTSDPGSTFLDRMIALVEGAQRQPTPNELALSILLTALSIVFLLVVLTLQPFAAYAGAPQPVPVLIALLVTLIPTTIGALLSAIGIAGMDRLVQRNVLATSGRAVEAAGDVTTLLLDKTGTITLGNRQADAVLSMPGHDPVEVARLAQLASLGDETPEGRSIVAWVARQHGLQPPEVGVGTVVAFSAHTRMSGLDADGRAIRKGATDAVVRWVTGLGGTPPPALQDAVEGIARSGGTPLALAVADDAGAAVVGVVHLKDVVKPGLPDRFDQLRRMGIRTVMVTGDNPVTARAVADEAGVDDVLAEATPEDKLALIRREQARGALVAMTGDGTNDAPALAQADVGMAMNSGTQACREAGNMVDLDSDPSKLIEVVTIGKELLMTRGALTTFSIANDVAKYFAIVPAMFVAAHPGLAALDVMRLSSPRSAILSAVVFNALIIVALIPLALRGVGLRPADAGTILRRNLLVYGLGGLVTPFVGIKLIDLVVSALGVA